MSFGFEHTNHPTDWPGKMTIDQLSVKSIEQQTLEALLRIEKLLIDAVQSFCPVPLGKKHK